MVDQSLHQPAVSTSPLPNTPRNPSIRESTAPPTTSTAPNPSPADSNKSTETDDSEPFDQYAPFPYSKAAFCEWFRKSSCYQRCTAAFVLLDGVTDYMDGRPQKTGPLTGQYTFVPAEDKMSNGIGASLLTVLGAGAFGSLFLFIATKMDLQPSPEAILRWSAETALGSFYVLLAVLFTSCAGIVFIAVCAMVWVPLYPLSHLTADGWNYLPRRIHLALKGTAAFTLIHCLLPSAISLRPFNSTVLYTLPSVAVGMDWWLEDLIRRAGRAGNGEEARVVGQASAPSASSEEVGRDGQRRTCLLL